MDNANVVLVNELRRLPGLSTLSVEEFLTPSLSIKVRLFICLIAQIPGGGEAVEELLRLQSMRERAKVAENSSKLAFLHSKNKEDEFRSDFFHVVGTTLRKLGAPITMTSYKKLLSNSLTCIHAFHFLASRSQLSSRVPKCAISIDAKFMQKGKSNDLHEKKMHSARSTLLNDRPEWQNVEIPLDIKFEEAPATPSLGKSSPQTAPRHHSSSMKLLKQHDTDIDIGTSTLSSFDTLHTKMSKPSTLLSKNCADIVDLKAENSELKLQLKRLQASYSALINPELSTMQKSEDRILFHTRMLMHQNSKLRLHNQLQAQALDSNLTVIYKTRLVLEQLNLTCTSLVELASDSQIDIIKNPYPSDLTGQSRETNLQIGLKPCVQTWRHVLEHVKQLRKELSYAEKASNEILHAKVNVGAPDTEFLKYRRKPRDVGHHNMSKKNSPNDNSIPKLSTRRVLSDFDHIDPHAVGALEHDISTMICKLETVLKNCCSEPYIDTLGSRFRYTQALQDSCDELRHLILRVSSFGAVINLPNEQTDTTYDCFQELLDYLSLNPKDTPLKASLLKKANAERKAVLATANSAKSELQLTRSAFNQRTQAVQTLGSDLKTMWNEVKRHIVLELSEPMGHIKEALNSVESCSGLLEGLYRGTAGPEVSVLMKFLCEYKPCIEDIAGQCAKFCMRIDRKFESLWATYEKETSLIFK